MCDVRRQSVDYLMAARCEIRNERSVLVDDRQRQTQTGQRDPYRAAAASACHRESHAFRRSADSTSEGSQGSTAHRRHHATPTAPSRTGTTGLPWQQFAPQPPGARPPSPCRRPRRGARTGTTLVNIAASRGRGDAQRVDTHSPPPSCSGSIVPGAISSRSCAASGCPCQA